MSAVGRSQAMTVELEKRIKELEEKLDLVTVHSKELEEQTRESFAKVLKLLSRFTSASNQISETVVSDLEKRADQQFVKDGIPQEIIDRLDEIDRRFEELEDKHESSHLA